MFPPSGLKGFQTTYEELKRAAETPQEREEELPEYL